MTLDRKYAKELLNYHGLKQAVTDRDKAAIVVTLRGLSLNDCYWLKYSDEVVSWAEVNLFNNSLSNALVGLSLAGDLTVSNGELSISDLTTPGVFPKAWIRKPDGFHLAKGNVDGSVEKELEAFRILSKFGFDVVQYLETVWKSGEPITTCKCFTNEQVGFVTAENLHYTLLELDSDINSFHKNYQVCYDMMVLADYLVGNSDRHQGNWGYLFWTDHGTIFGMPPLFDFNHAFEATTESLCLPERFCGRRVTQLGAAVDAYKRLRVKDSVIDLNKKLDLSDFKYGQFVELRIAMLLDRYTE